MTHSKEELAKACEEAANWLLEKYMDPTPQTWTINRLRVAASLLREHCPHYPRGAALWRLKNLIIQALQDSAVITAQAAVCLLQTGQPYSSGDMSDLASLLMEARDIFLSETGGPPRGPAFSVPEEEEV